MSAIIDFSKPLVTPEELHWLLGWPLPASATAAPRPVPPTPPVAPAAPLGPQTAGLHLGG